MKRRNPFRFLSNPLLHRLNLTDTGTCFIVLACGSNQFQCRTRRNCISQCKACDGKFDCADGSDEHNCSTYGLMFYITLFSTCCQFYLGLNMLMFKSIVATIVLYRLISSILVNVLMGFASGRLEKTIHQNYFLLDQALVSILY